MQTITDVPRWINPPALFDAEILAALKDAIAKIKAGLGRKNPFGASMPPIELSGGYLNVTRTMTGGVMAHWLPHVEEDENEDEDKDGHIVLH